MLIPSPSRPGRRRVPVSPVTPRALRPLLLATLLALLGFASAPASAAASQAEEEPVLAAGVLEEVIYEHNGQERTVIASVAVDGADLRLTIFSPILATEYETRIPSSALVSSRRLDDEELAAELAHRAECHAEQARKRELARKKREERQRREAEELEEEARASGGRVTREQRAARAKLTRERATVGARQLVRYAKELDTRKDRVVRRTAALVTAVNARRVDVPSRAKELREIQVWLEEVELALEKLDRRLEARHSARARLEEDAESGALRGKDLAEQVEYVFEQYELLETEYEEIESTLTSQAEAFSIVPEEEPPAPPPEELANSEETTATRTARPAPAAARGTDGTPARSAHVATTPHGTALPRSEWTEEERALVEARDADARSGTAPEPDESAGAGAARSETARVERVDPVDPEATEPEAEEPAAPARATAADETAPSTESSGGSGLPIWPLYIFGALAVYFSWKRRPAAPHPRAFHGDPPLEEDPTHARRSRPASTGRPAPSIGIEFLEDERARARPGTLPDA